jgi:hypothetical protein
LNQRRKFSIRHGIQPEPAPRLEDAPEPLRYFLLKYLERRFHLNPWQAAEIFEDFLQQPGLKSYFHNPHDASVWKRMYAYIETFKWFQVYDFAEAIYDHEPEGYRQPRFVQELNAVLLEQNVSYRMNPDGQIIYRGPESFESIVAVAKSALNAAGKRTATEEIHKALEDMSKRPPDLTGAVHHAMASLECVANDVCGEKGATLGQFVKKHPDRFPQPVGQAVSLLYGFASSKGRHVTEGGEPDIREVELIVGIAATLATYLIR